MIGRPCVPDSDIRGRSDMIKISGLTKVYKGVDGDVLALEDLGLEVARGDIFGIIGLSGAGKSTLIRCINLLERPTAGSIEVDGREITGYDGARLRELRGSLGMIFQRIGGAEYRHDLIADKFVQSTTIFENDIDHFA